MNGSKCRWHCPPLFNWWHRLSSLCCRGGPTCPPYLIKPAGHYPPDSDTPCAAPWPGPRPRQVAGHHLQGQIDSRGDARRREDMAVLDHVKLLLHGHRRKGLPHPVSDRQWVVARRPSSSPARPSSRPRCRPRSASPPAGPVGRSSQSGSHSRSAAASPSRRAPPGYPAAGSRPGCNRGAPASPRRS